MEKRCYLVCHLDTTTTPPRVLGTGLYSESAETLTGAISTTRFAFDVTSHRGEDYEQAKSRLLDMPEPFKRAYAWALDMLPEGQRG